MEQLLNRLLNLLDDEIDLYRTLLTVYQHEREALLAFEIEGITAASTKKENLILKIKIIEEQRLHVIDRIARDLNQVAADLTITRLADKVDIRYSHQLSSRGAELSSILEKIGVLHQSNRSLITHSQSLVRDSLIFLSDNLAPDPVYHRDGSVSRKARSGRLVTRII
jgi:flagellar biosynthesis/type III secretory pathway chaperone